MSHRKFEHVSATLCCDERVRLMVYDSPDMAPWASSRERGRPVTEAK